LEKNRESGGWRLVRATLDPRALEKTLNNIVNYSYGFLDGVGRGKKKFLENMGEGVIQALATYIDAMARADKDALHHVYEWYMTGSPAARLFDLNYTVSNLGLSVKSSFSQSKSISEFGNTPFYDKAKVMESGVPITIKPKASGVLVFNEGGKDVFTKRPITVENPGGPRVQGSYERVFDTFFKFYFTQAFLKSSGLFEYIKKPTLYKKDFAKGSRGGRSVGIKTGYTWIANAKIGAE
jgi:hypothetical protein